MPNPKACIEPDGLPPNTQIYTHVPQSVSRGIVYCCRPATSLLLGLPGASNRTIKQRPADLPRQAKTLITTCWLCWYMTCGQGQPFTKLTLDEHVSAGGVYLCELLPRRQPHLLAVDSPARRCVRMWARKQDDDGDIHIPERQRDTEKQVARRLSGRQKGGGGGVPAGVCGLLATGSSKGS